MFSNLIPGFRRIRGPLTGGLLWLLVIALLADVDDPDLRDTPLKVIPEVADSAEGLGLVGLALLGAYLLGSILDDVLAGLFGALLSRITKTRVLWSDRTGYAEVVRDLDEKILKEHERRVIESVRVRPDEPGPNPKAEEVLAESDRLRFRALRHSELQPAADTLDQEQAEAQFRRSIVLPLFILIAIVIVKSDASGFVSLVLLLANAGGAWVLVTQLAEHERVTYEMLSDLVEHQVELSPAWVRWRDAMGLWAAPLNQLANDVDRLQGMPDAVAETAERKGITLTASDTQALAKLDDEIAQGSSRLQADTVTRDDAEGIRQHLLKTDRDLVELRESIYAREPDRAQ